MKKKLVFSVPFLSVLFPFCSAEEVGIVENIKNFTSNLGSFFGDLIQSIKNFTSNLGSFFGDLIQSINSIGQSIINVLSYIWSILKALWLGLTSLLSPIGDLISQVLGNGAISSLSQTMDSIASYIGGPAVVFIMTLFLIILVRIVIAFVFKVFRLNIDYNSLQVKNKAWQQISKKKFSKFDDD